MPAVTPEQALVASAYWFGRRAARSTRSSGEALRLTRAGISHFEPLTTPHDMERLLFYRLVEAEILRGTRAALGPRRAAKALSDRLGCAQFEYYLELVNATQTRRAVDGFTGGTVIDAGLRPGLGDNRMGEPNYGGLRDGAAYFLEEDQPPIFRGSLLEALRADGVTVSACPPAPG